MKLRILIVDDDAVFRSEFSDALQSEGHDVAAAPSVAQGIAALEKHPFDVVFTDLRMPREGGLDLVRQVRRRWSHALIIVVTGFATVETAVEAMRLGAFDYVQKPFRIEAVRKALALVEQEIAFAQLSLLDHSPAALAGEAARREGLDVLLVSLAPPPSLPPRVQHVTLDPLKPYKIKDEFARFAEGKTRAGLVVGDMDRVLVIHTAEDVVNIIRKLRDEVGERGPIAIGFDPSSLRAVLSRPCGRLSLRRSSTGSSTRWDHPSVAGSSAVSKQVKRRSRSSSKRAGSRSRRSSRSTCVVWSTPDSWVR